MNPLRRLRALLRKEKLDAEMTAELRAHLELQAAENEKRGMSPEEARHAAQRSFGGVEQLKERCRDERSWIRFEQFLQDLRFGVRSLRKNPGFTVVVVLTLALGVGATTAIFSVANALILRPLPVRAPEELVAIVIPYFRPNSSEPVSGRLYEQFRERASSLLDVFVFDDSSSRTRPFLATGVGATETEFVNVAHVTGNFFSALGVQAALGRTIGPDDDRREQPAAVAVLGHAFWQRRFGGDPAIIGRTVVIEKTPFTVIGVSAPGFFGINVGSDCDVWCPQRAARLLEPGRPEDDPDDQLGFAMGRLRPGVAREEAQRALALIYQQNVARLAEGKNLADPVQRLIYTNRTLELQSGAYGYRLRGSLQDQFKRPIGLLLAATGIVLLTVCANVAGLLLVRGAARQREVAVRAALGAGRGRLVRQFLVESLLLAVAGGLLGWLAARGGCVALAHYLPSETVLDLSPDGRVLGFAGAITLGTGVLCGLVPAWRARRIDVTTALKRQSGTLAGGAGQRLNRLLVVAQIALSLVILAGASLLGRTLVNLRTIDAGFSRDHLLLFSIDSGRDFAGKRGDELARRIVARLETHPGVSGVTTTWPTLLLDEGWRNRIDVEGYVPARGEIVDGWVFEVGPRFFATMDLPLRRGRDLTADDFRAGARPVAVIGESMARTFFGPADPIGRHIKRDGRSLEIVGVARDVKSFENLRGPARPTLYHPFYADDPDRQETHFAIRTAGEPLALASGVREIVRGLAPQARVFNLRTMDAAVEETLVRERVLAQLSTVFAIFTAGLASLGLYGLLSFGVIARTREIGLRVALGAEGRDVVLFVVRQGLWLSLAGAALGLAASFGAARFLETFFYGVSATDWTTWGLTSGLLFAVTGAACWLPARRAAKVDPMIALRCE